MGMKGEAIRAGRIMGVMGVSVRMWFVGKNISGFLSFPVREYRAVSGGKGKEPRDIPKLTFHFDW